MRGDLWVGEGGSRLGTSSFFSLYHVVPEFRNMLGFAQFLLAREHKRRDENGRNELCFEAVENFSSNRKKKAPPPTCLLLLSDPWRAAAAAPGNRGRFCTSSGGGGGDDAAAAAVPAPQPWAPCWWWWWWWWWPAGETWTSLWVRSLRSDPWSWSKKEGETSTSVAEAAAAAASLLLMLRRNGDFGSSQSAATSRDVTGNKRQFLRKASMPQAFPILNTKEARKQAFW